MEETYAHDLSGWTDRQVHKVKGIQGSLESLFAPELPFTN